MDDPFGVRRAETVRHGGGHLHRFAPGQRPPPQAVAHGLAFQQLHDRVGQAVLCAEVVDGEDVGVAQRSHGARLAQESRGRIGVRDERPREHLHRHVAPEARIVGAVDLAHPTLPQRLHDPVVAQMRAWLDGGHW
jgi:hypothetical protein